MNIGNNQSFWKATCRFFSPVKYVPKSYAFFVLSEGFDVFWSIFRVQLGFYVISSIESANSEGVIFWTIVLGGGFLIRQILGLASEVIYEYLQLRLGLDIRHSSLKQLVSFSHHATESLGIGKIQNIIEQGTKERKVTITRTSIGIIGEALGIVYAFTVMLSQSPSIYHFLGLTIIFVVATFFIWKGLIILTRVRKQSKEMDLDISRNNVKIYMSKIEILQNDKLQQELQYQEDITKKQIRMRQKGNFKKGLWQTGSGTLINGLQIGIYLIVGLGVISGNYTIAYLFLLLELVRTSEKYIWNIRWRLKHFMDSYTHIEKLRDFLDNTPTIDGYKTGESFNYQGGSVALRNLCFSYGEISGSQIFSNLSLSITGGSKTALVGPSGGGKSTIIKLIAGYLRPDSGSVIVDGQDLTDVSLKSYYKHIGYLTQEPSVFDGTVWDNLTYAMETNDPDLVMERVREAIEDAQCQFIWELPEGVYTEIGERGVRLSGGQRQRLAIAKIFLKDPAIVLLDEPTSALDSESEEKVTIAMNRLFEGRTVIVIAHRLQTVKHADRILYIEDGKVVEEGTHKQLMKRTGKYYTMVELQSGF